ncbi:metalloregulator ArsR/SmtB family transcription factor [Kocuria sp. cx-116]|uniref:ArsR/SmtB family transcription factor n=1 Tax=Kocuria sp. cx-116 TaxID=2771378 RepID=UPI00168881E3|nr:metalloregulator ArsR/SmtB family transcription factor [Kocuria sp. cx-116]MBD2762216.1 metalloregulator ArsR/SmtB family transcription factor [Kocuria sp. cx-116]
MANDSYSALSDPTRRRILSALSHGSRPVGELVEELEVSQPTVSKHLKVLRDTGLVATRAEGQKRFYSVQAQPLREVTAWIEDLLSAAEVPVAPDTGDEPRHLPWFGAPEAVEEPAQDAGQTVTNETSESMELDSKIAETPVFGVISDDNETSERENVQETPEEPEVSDTSTLPDAVALGTEVEVTGASVEANTDVTSAEPSADSVESDGSNTVKPEYGIPPVRSGGAHRRQSGLLSTLTGFRRRGRSSRR